MSKSVARSTRNVNPVRRELQAAVCDSRRKGEMQPLPGTLVVGSSRSGPQVGRRRLLLRAILDQDDVAFDGS